MNSYTEGYRLDGPQGDVTYRVYGDGQVVAYGIEVEPIRTDRFRASAWDKHPLDHADARHLTHLCADATHAELARALSHWHDIVQEHQGDAALGAWSARDAAVPSGAEA